MYISRDDLNKNLYGEIINAVTCYDSTREDYGIRGAIETAKAYLSARYDVDYLFSFCGEDRNYLVVDICANIALYIIADVLENMPVTIQSAYDQSMGLLEKLSDPESNISLPGIPSPVDPETGERDTYIRWGGDERNNY